MYDDATIAALEAGLLVPRDFLTVHGKTLDGTPQDFCFWTGEDDIAVDVVSAVDGSTVARNYIGGGTLLVIDPIVWAIGLDVRTTNITLNQLNSAVQDMLRGNDIRHVVAELHRGLYAPSTWQLVSTPFPRLLGKIDSAPLVSGEVGGAGSLTLGIVNDTVELTRMNPGLKSDESQKLRSGDRFRRYADTVTDVQIWWGMKPSSTASA